MEGGMDSSGGRDSLALVESVELISLPRITSTVQLRIPVV